MTKRTLWRLVAVLLAFTLVAAACGDDDDDGDEPAETTEAPADDGGEEPSETTEAPADDGGEEPSETTEAPADDGGDEGEGDDGAAGPPAEAPGFDGTTISVGIISDLSGPAALIGNPLTNGGRAYYEFVNSQGGIAGQYPIEQVEVDSTYNPTTGVQVYNEIKDDVAIIGQVLGTPITNAVLESIQGDGLMAAPASLDAFWVREPNLLPLGAPYQTQAINGIDWWINEGGGSTDQVYCAFIQDDPYGEAGLAGLDFVAERVGIEITETARFVAGDADYSSQIQQLQGANCEVVWLTALPSTVGAALGAAAQSNFNPTWIGNSPVFIGALAQSALAPYLEANLIVMNEGPNWGDESVPGMVEMIDSLEQFTPDQGPDYYFQFGYAQAKLVVAVLEQAVANGDLSREGILEASTQIGDYDFDGLYGTYSYGPAEDRQPPTGNTVFRVSAESPTGVEQIGEWESEYATEFEY